MPIPQSTGLRRTASAACVLVALAAPASAACVAPQERWTEIELYMGRNIENRAEVSEGQFARFLRDVVTPLFPDGLTVLDAVGQFSDSGRAVREKTKLLVLLVPDAKAAAPKVSRIVDAYKAGFRQQSVLHTQTAVCLSFD